MLGLKSNLVSKRGPCNQCGYPLWLMWCYCSRYVRRGSEKAIISCVQYMQFTWLVVDVIQRILCCGRNSSYHGNKEFANLGEMQNNRKRLLRIHLMLRNWTLNITFDHLRCIRNHKSGGRPNINIPSDKYRDPHNKDNLYNGYPYTQERRSLYWDGTRVIINWVGNRYKQIVHLFNLYSPEWLRYE